MMGRKVEQFRYLPTFARLWKKPLSWPKPAKCML